MSMTDPLGDMLARIKNGHMRRKAQVNCPASKLKESVLSVLKREGYIRDFRRDTDDATKPELVIELKYYEGEPVIREIGRVSKPGRRVYSNVREMPRVYGGLGVTIVSTPQGVMTDHEARAANVGGEVLCKVF
ncbi:MAG: 30S ribosomal protein S8 [Alphaproteobacteria bacterium]|jgi:small subunit ribosomal protein S8|nr:30S ribosomal protein S8 [Rhodospirillaceae bacterium]MDG2482159.1 30S ribosomal protein S8 [Alphaproteobacteria bacterium]